MRQLDHEFFLLEEVSKWFLVDCAAEVLKMMRGEILLSMEVTVKRTNKKIMVVAALQGAALAALATAALIAVVMHAPKVRQPFDLFGSRAFV